MPFAIDSDYLAGFREVSPKKTNFRRQKALYIRLDRSEILNNFLSGCADENSMRRSDGSTRKIFAFRTLICLVLLMLAVPGVISARLVTAALRGGGTHPQGAAVPAVKCTITDTAPRLPANVTASFD